MADEVNYKVAEDFKVTVSLYSGSDVVIDLMKVTAEDWKVLIKKDTPEDKEYELVGKATGFTVKALKKMPQPDYRLLAETFIKIAIQPLSNPT